MHGGSAYRLRVGVSIPKVDIAILSMLEDRIYASVIKYQEPLSLPSTAG